MSRDSLMMASVNRISVHIDISQHDAVISVSGGKGDLTHKYSAGEAEYTRLNAISELVLRLLISQRLKEQPLRLS